MLTNHYDRPFHPEIEPILGSYFENFGPITANQLPDRSMRSLPITNHETRVETVEAYPLPDTYSYKVDVYFYVENMPAELVEFSTLLEKTMIMRTNQYGKLEVTDLDFDTVKDNFKVFLKQQSVFTDYDFEGSGMSVLMDLLHTHTILHFIPICLQTKCSWIRP